MATISKEKYIELRKKGWTPERIDMLQKGYSPKDLKIEESKKTEGFVKRVARGILEPVATLAVRPFQVGKALSGASEEEQAVSLPFLGRINTVSSGKDVLKDVGRAVETVALGVGGVGTKSVVQTGLRGAIKQSAIQGAKVGATSGGLISFGQALQDAEVQPANVAIKTLQGAAIGGLTGGAVGAITPIVVKGINYSKRFTDIKQINQELQNLNTKVFKPTNYQTTRWSKTGKDPIKTFTEIFGTDVPQVGKDNRFVKESIQEFAQRVDDIYKPASGAFNNILQNSPEVVDLQSIQSGVINNIKNAKIKDSLKTQIIKNINKEFKEISSGQFASQIQNGKVPVAIADNIKDTFWMSTNWKNPLDKIANQTDYVIGKGWQKAIEKSVKDVNVNTFNKQLGDLIELRNFLLTKSGATAGTGGKMTRLFGRLTGTIAGSKGGPFGSVLGNLTGDKIAQIMIDPSMAPYRWVVQKKLSQLPAAEILKLETEANKIIQEIFARRMATLNLPSPSFIPMGAPKIPNIPADTFSNTALRNMQSRINTPELPAPSPRTITPNTKGTPNFVRGVSY